MIIIRGENQKAKTKCEFRGEELLGPQASSRVSPCPPAPNHTRGEVIRPPSQIKNNSYSVIRTRDLDDLCCIRCAPTITTRPSQNCILYQHKLSVQRVLKYRVGGEGQEVCLTKSAIERFRSYNITQRTDKIDRNEEYCYGGRPRLPGLRYQECASGQCYTAGITHFYLSGCIYFTQISFTLR